MRASLTVAGVELVLVTPPGRIEDIVLATCSPYLGATVAPRCTVQIGELAGDRPLTGDVRTAVGRTKVRFRGDAVGEIHLTDGGQIMVAPDNDSIKAALASAVAVISPQADVLVLRASAGLRDGVADVHLGLRGPAVDAAVFADAVAAMKLGRDGRWVVCSTPFGRGDATSVPRQATLGRCVTPAEGRALPDRVLRFLYGPLDETGWSRARRLQTSLGRHVVAEVHDAVLHG